jgi:hypothetical protein
MGNRTYPPPFDLPASPKNVRDLTAALEGRGFKVTDALDLPLDGARQAVASFLQQAAQAPKDATFFFYFVGHGVQVESANLLLPAGLDPAAKEDTLRKDSLQLLSDVVTRLPERKTGLNIAVVDACRTTLKAGVEDGGLNQVEAPPGCLIAFSTGAGKPAIAPAVETQNTFYTASLVRLLGSVSDATNFPDLFKLVKTDVHTTMLNFPVEAIRKLAQDPFIADHSLVPVALGSAESLAKTPPPDEADDADWARLQQVIWPPEVLQLASEFLRQHPKSRHASGAQVARDGAVEAAKILQRSDVRLYRSAFNLSDDMTEDQRRDVVRAGRGDKDAAARQGRTYRAETNAAGRAARYEGWMPFASALGNGIAAYELAVYYRRSDQPLLASQFESRARELGYTPPPTLDNVRK